MPDAAGKMPGDDEPSPFATPFGVLYCRGRDVTDDHTPIPRAMYGSTAKVNAAIAGEPALAGLDLAKLVLVDNNRAFGGAGTGGIGWVSMKGDWVWTAIHELGHSAFGLADEYDFGGPPRQSRCAARILERQSVQIVANSLA